MTATTTPTDVEPETEVEPGEEPAGDEIVELVADVTSLLIPQHTLSSEDDIDVPTYELGEVVCFVGQSRIEKNTLGRRKRDGQLVLQAKVDRDGQLAIVGRTEVEDLLAADRQRRTGQLELLSDVGEFRRAGRTFADRAEHHRAEGRSRDQVDGWGIRVVLGRAAGHLTTVKDLTTDDGQSHPLHWSDPASIDEDVIDAVEREIDEAGAYLCAARDWVVRHRGRLNEARAEAKKVAAKDGVVLTEAEVDDLRSSNGAVIEHGPRGPEAQTIAIVQLLNRTETRLTAAEVADQANVSVSRTRDILNELERKGSAERDKTGKAHTWAIVERAGGTDADDDVVPSLDELDEA